MSSTLRIAYASDFHAEWDPSFLTKDGALYKWAAYVSDKADILVLAGDICSATKFRDLISLLDEFNKPVIYVAGNHEFYGLSREHGLRLIREAVIESGSSNFIFLENETAEVGGVLFIGGTGWYDGSGHVSGVQNRQPPSRLLNDCSRIFDMPHDGAMGFNWGRQFVKFLVLELVNRHYVKDEKPCVVVTHHAPSLRSVPRTFAGDPANYCFANSWEEFCDVDILKAWIHGHIHRAKSYAIDNTRIVCNPYGMCDRDGSRLEDTKFKKGAIIEVQICAEKNI